MSDVRPKSLSFLDLYSGGKVTAEHIDDFIDAWHESDDSEQRPLSEFLGMTETSTPYGWHRIRCCHCSSLLGGTGDLSRPWCSSILTTCSTRRRLPTRPPSTSCPIGLRSGRVVRRHFVASDVRAERLE